MAPSLTAAEWAALPFRVGLLWARVLLTYVEALWSCLTPARPAALRSKVVLVTGAAQGIGRATAQEFARRGARLAIWDINKDGAEETARLITEAGGVAFAYQCDITQLAAVKQAAASTQRDLGDVDVVVNNAGIMVVKPFLNLSEQDIRRTFEINSIAHFWIIQQFLPAMLERDEGHIVTVASMAGRAGVPLLTDYCASKWAAVGFTESLAEEMRRKKSSIGFSTVCPMFVNTNLVHGVSDRAVMRNKYGRLLEPEEVANAIVDGVRYRQAYIYVPPSMGFAVFLGPLLPRKARHLLNDFIDSSFVEVGKRE